jgi:hypothetical protein
MERSTSARHRASAPRRCTVQPQNDAQHSALARLYARRSAVRKLIGALERYQLEQSRQRANGGVLTDEEMSS